MLKLYNTLTRKKEVFRPGKSKKVNFFVCGITSYDFSHIGHARTYIVFDMIVKFLRQRGYNVFYLQNITDIDDKIIKRAKEKNVSWQQLSRKFEKEYLKDMRALKIDSVTEYARATDHIKEIISQVDRLLEKEFAYQTKGGIYYDISKFKDYGKLSRRTVLQAEDAVSRIDEAREKRNKGDFCLWKFSGSGDPGWKSPWGWGRPGWHIEDTAITEKYFGSQYDIHGGAKDLIFPHHEAEIAQMEAISGKKPLVKYWLHSGFLTVRGEKMAKSLGNFITIKDFLEKFSPSGARILRFFVLKSHYRSPVDYDEELILQTKKEIERIDEFVEKIQNPKPKRQIKSKIQNPKSAQKLILKAGESFERALEDDFNTPQAMAVIFEIIRQVNPLLDKELLGKSEAKEILDFFKKIDKFFNFIFWQKKKERVPQKVQKLAREREEYREQKNWKAADEIRQKIEKLGWQIEDTKSGPKIKKS